MGLGLFGGGVGAARYFARRGARVTVTDLKDARTLRPSVEALAGLPVTFHLDGHVDADFTGADIVAVSPAVPPDSPYIRMAEAAGAVITSEMNLFMAECPARVLGVTGSNGKSTTTALAADMLRRAGPSRMGGNIGKSLLDELQEISPGETVVLELSSFQLDDLGRLGISPQVAAVTNVSPNHLDRHLTMENYIAAKKNILRFQGTGGVAVLNADDPEVASWADETPGRTVFFSTRPMAGEGVFAEAGEIVLRLDGAEDRVCLAGRLRLRGRHNLSNVLCAAAAARVCGATAENISEAIADFRPLPHRLEPVGRLGGVEFIDDSKATTPVASKAAIEAFDEPLVLIAGGYDKQIDPAPMIKAIRAGGVRAVMLIGQTAAALAEAIGTGGPAVERHDTLPAAVARAAALARPGDVVLLSTGHASWGMFTNYEERSRVFIQAALDLGMTPNASVESRG
jgi:UDP-N-acetylmuramoylalanine--D-glutamate ligase